MIGHYFECFWKCDSLDVTPDSPDELLYYFTNFTSTDSPDVCEILCSVRIDRRVIVPPRNESHLQIYLRKLRLSVLSPIFVTEAFGDLKVTIDTTRAYEELLWLLRGLSKRVETRFSLK